MDKTNVSMSEELNNLDKKKEDLKMMETEMNQQKLSMLIKFDKIVFLEDFYNQNQITRNTGKDSIRLDIDMNYEQLAQCSTKLFINHSKRVQAEEKKRYWAL